MAGEGTHLANAYVSLSTNTKGLRKEIDKAVGGATAGGDKQGRGLGSRVAGGFKKVAKAGFAGAGAIAGAALVKGFGRLRAIDDAEGKLRGLGHSTKAVDGIMNDALKSVKGTAFGLDEAATGAAGMVAAGIKPGKELQSVLGLVGDAATIAGTDFDSMSAIFGKVAATGKLQGDEILQLSEAGIPALQFLSKELGVSSAEVSEMASKGEIDFDTFARAMEGGLGGAAQESGKTFSGAWANMNAALGRVGAAMLTGIFPKIQGAMVGLTGIFDKMTPVAERWGALLGAVFVKVGSAVGGFVSDFRAGEGAAGQLRSVLSSLWQSLSGAASSAFRALLPHLKTFASSMAALWPKVKSLASAVGGFLMAAFRAAQPYLKAFALIVGAVLVGALKILPPILSVVMSALGGLLGFLRPLLPVVAAVGAALLTKFVVGLIASGVQWAIAAAKAVLFNVQMAIFIARTYAAAAAQKIAAVATKAWAIAQRLMNAAMRANPIGLLITGLLLLGAGLVLAYKKSETFRRVVNAAWAGIKAAASATVGWFRNTAWPWMKAVFTNIGNAAKWLWKNGIKPAFNGIKNVIVWWYQNIVKRYFALARAAFRGLAAVAKWLYNNGIKPAFRGIVALAKWLWANGIKPAFNRIRGGIRAFAAAAKWLHNRGIKPAFRAIATVAKWLWGRIKYFFGAIRGAIRVLAAAAKWLYNKGIKPAFGWIAGRAKWLWGKIKYWFDRWRLGMSRMADKAKWLYTKGVKPAFGWIADRAKWMWGKVKDIFAKLRAGLSKVRDAFRVARNKIGDAWGGILTRIKRPIGRALRWLKNNFVDKLRGWLKGIPGIGKLNKIMPTISVPKGFARGGWTGAGSMYKPAGIVHADEFVVKKSSRRKFEKENPGALDHINRHGRLPFHPGYAEGGRVLPGYAKGGMVYHDMARWFRANFPRHRITSSYRPGSRTAASNSLSYHARGKALDMSPSMAIFNKIKKTFGTAIRELIFSPAGGRQVHNGRNHRYTGITRAMHWDHVHWAMNSMKKGSMKGLLGSLSGGGGILPDWAQPGWLLGKVKGVMKGFDSSKYGIVGKVIPQMATAVRKAVQKKVTSLADALDFSGGPGMDFSDVAKGANQVMGKAMAKKYGWTGRNWTSLKALWHGESGWNHRAKNPSSGAYGIPQSLPASKMRSAGADYLTNAKTQIAWGLRYIKDRYGSPSNAYSKWRSRSPHWYAKGTDSARSGLAVVGENGPELVRFAGGEQVFTRQQSLRLARSTPNVPAMAGAGALSGPMTFNLYDSDGMLMESVHGVLDDRDRQQQVRDRLRRV